MKTLSSPSTERNRDPILEKIQNVIQPGHAVFEIASGTGEHGLYFSTRLKCTWHPSDIDPQSLDSIRAWIEQERADCVEPPIKFDVLGSAPKDLMGTFDTVFNCNMIHISPPSTVPALFARSRELLKPHGQLITYGPYRFRDRELEPSNINFEKWLKDKDPTFGVRVFEDVAEVAANSGFEVSQCHAMPANNHLIVWSSLGN